ncbi:MAG: trypsin-like peptidase domain-containing protein [Bacteriovoracaceae bacterium]|nr:trypsin-like peptidase domain-containing protein [Bacteriovoracaceae bacterium]
MVNKVQLMALSGALLFQVTPEAHARVIYGEDHRVEVFQATSFQQNLASSAATMIASSSLFEKSSKYMEVSQKDTLRKFLESMTDSGLPACKSERFLEQPIAGNCSGFLIAPDLLVTAGHCVTDESACNDNQWVFDYKVDKFSKKGGAKMPKENVYNCKKVMSQSLNSALNLDYAVVQLDRPVSGRTPLEINNGDELKNYTKLLIIGSPTGLPLKVAAGAHVRENEHPHYFKANLDSFGGNSGSGVFNANSGTVEGILVRGERDFEVDWINECVKSYRCQDSSCQGEAVTRLTVIPEVGIQRALNQAALEGDMENLSKLLKLGTWVDFYSKDGQSALMKAAQGGKVLAIEALLNAGAVANLQDAQGNSSLHHLAKNLNKKTEAALDLLLAKGAKLELKNANGETALSIAAKNSNAEGVMILTGKSSELN